MQIGFIGLGRMGSNMVERLLKAGHDVAVYNRSPEPVKALEKKGAKGSISIGQLIEKLIPPRAIWVMVPAGEITGKVIQELTLVIQKNDLIIDGGNSNYKDSIWRASELAKHGFYFMDVGTSGGIWGLQNGYALMIGGEEESFKRLEPIFKSLAPKDGYQHVGPHGAGHFVKMIHNGIEYGMLQAYGEGFEIMKASEFKLDFAKISHLWNQGSVVRSWLLELAEIAFKKDPELAKFQDYIEDSGEGRWAVLEAIQKNISAPVITMALLERFRSREESCFSAKLIAALRNEFGGHAFKKQ